MDSNRSLPSPTLARATDLSRAPSVCGPADGVGPVSATRGGATRIRTFHSRRFSRASFCLPHPKPVPNRELDLLKRGLNRCKQRTATVSNRELSTVCNHTDPSAALIPSRIQVALHGTPVASHETRSVRDQVAVLLRGTLVADRGSRPLAPFLTGSAPQTEIDVTCTKQTTEKFLTGSRTAIKDFASRQVRP
jgi:hypothetical protein